MKYQQSRSSIFLMEIILNILLFAVLVIVGLQFFIKAHNLTNQATELQRAVSCVTSVASVYENGDGSLGSIQELYPYAVRMEQQVTIYYNDSYQECEKDDASYYVSINEEATNVSSLKKAIITFYNKDFEEVYKYRVCNYTPLKASRLEGANGQ